MRKLDKRAKKSSVFGAGRKNKAKLNQRDSSRNMFESKPTKTRSSSTKYSDRAFNSISGGTRVRKTTSKSKSADFSKKIERNAEKRVSFRKDRSFEKTNDRTDRKRSKSSFEKKAPSFRARSSSFKPRENRFERNSPVRKRSFRGKYIDESLFVNKATKKTEIESYEPKNTFADFNVAEVLAKNLKSRGYIKPSPIQDQSIPVALTGKDVIGIAATGTGKTAAFLIPLINKIELDKKQKVMILTPTREIAQQIQEELMNFTVGMKVFSVTCVGGMPIFPQMRQLSRGVNVVIGTPGRVQDLMRRGKIRMSEYNSIVLDEADRMLDMGFIDDMREILSEMPKDKHGLFFSATFDTKIKELCNDFLDNPITVSVKTRDTSGSVDQDVVRVLNRNDKIEQLHKILNHDGAKKVLIFREMKKSVDELTMELKGRGIKALGLHGDMRNRERERAVEALKNGQIQALIATDVAARGIHISDISHVINYDIPNDYETYIHRIGRTGRGEAKGIALTFI